MVCDDKSPRHCSRKIAQHAQNSGFAESSRTGQQQDLVGGIDNLLDEQAFIKVALMVFPEFTETGFSNRERLPCSG